MKYNLIIADDDADFGHKAKTAFYDALNGINRPKVILPTGNTPAPFYKDLRESGDCPSFTYIALDEYTGLMEDDKRLFKKWLAQEILDPLEIKVRWTFNSAANPACEIEKMRALFFKNGHADVAILGIGENGHVGFNEPGSPFNESVRHVRLTEETRKANMAYWGEQYGVMPTHALTLGIADLIESKKTILLARGAAKAEILQRALHGEITTDVPASYLQRQENVTIVADRAAAQLLPH